MVKRLAGGVGQGFASRDPPRELHRDRRCLAGLVREVGGKLREVGIDVVAVPDVERAPEHGDTERGTELVCGVVDRRGDPLLGPGE